MVCIASDRRGGFDRARLLQCYAALQNSCADIDSKRSMDDPDACEYNPKHPGTSQVHPGGSQPVTTSKPMSAGVGLPTGTTQTYGTGGDRVMGFEFMMG